MAEPNAGGAAGDIGRSIGSTMGGAARFIRGMGQGMSSGASAKLKFDVTGLKDFTTELGKATTGVNALAASFGKLGPAPKDFTANLLKTNTALKDYNTQIKEAAKNGKGFSTPAGPAGTTAGAGSSWAPPTAATQNQSNQEGFSGGSPGNSARFTGYESGRSRPPSQLISKAKNYFTNKVSGTASGESFAGGEVAAPTAEAGAVSGGGGGGAAAGAGSGLAIIGAIAKVTAAAVTAITNRVQSGNEKALQQDYYASPMAIALGTGSPNDIHSALSARGGAGAMLGDSQEIYGALRQQQKQGAYTGPGATGMGAARGKSMTDSVGGLQQTDPSLTATAATSIVQSAQSNIGGQKTASLFLGNAAISRTSSGGQKDLQSWFKEILVALQNRRAKDKGKPFTKDMIQAMQMPGSNARQTLAMIFDEETMDQFFLWAMAQTTYSPSGDKTYTGTDEQAKSIRGQSVAVEGRETESANQRRDSNFTSNQYSGIISQADSDQRVVGHLQSMDNALGGIYNMMQGNPLGTMGQSLFAGGVNAMAGIFGGDLPPVGDTRAPTSYPMGDATSQLNPDLRPRIQAMMKANPNLSITSGFRSPGQQQKFYESGNPNAAPLGKSRHTRGQAVDIGPRSQLGWVGKNAKKFGLDHATSKGEPWHLQLAGTLVGDPMGDTTMNDMSDFRMRMATVGQQSMLATAMEQQVNRQRGNAAAAPKDDAALSADGTSAAGSGTGSGSGTTTPSGGTGSTTNSATTPGGIPAGPASGLTAKLTATPEMAKASMSMEQIAQVVYAAGFRGDQISKMVGISMRESGGHYANIIHDSDDWGGGLWGLNTLGMSLPTLSGWIKSAGGTMPDSTDPETLRANILRNYQDPMVAAKIAFQMYSQSGGAGGDYGPWTTGKYTNGHGDPSKSFVGVDLPAAEAAVASAKSKGLIGDVTTSDQPLGMQSLATSSSLQAPPVSMMITNNFSINLASGGASGGGGHMDIDGLVRQISVKLEPQLRRAMATQR